MSTQKLFTPIELGTITLKNRVAMSPMTRCRAIGNIPNELMAEYYGQRAGAGLIITEGTSPSPNGLGYARMPGIFNQEQVAGWKKVTDSVHAAGGKIFVQIMHAGRIAHSLNLPEGSMVLAPSAVKAQGEMWTDSAQMQDLPVPKAMTAEEVQTAKQGFVNAARNAIAAGFDGVELHAANGYLLEQFLSPIANVRSDEYGGNIKNRVRFVLEVSQEVVNVIGKEKTGIRISPYGVASDMPHYPEIDATYKYLAQELNKIGLVYIHLTDHSAMGAPEVPISIKETIRKNFKNTLILAGGFNQESAEAILQSGLGDMVGIGRPFLNNPDLVDRYRNNHPIATELNMDAFYSADSIGYTDYPAYQN